MRRLRAFMQRLGGLFTRDRRELPRLDMFLQDLRGGVRKLRRSPALTLAMVTTLALTLGATSVIVSLVYGVLLRPLPYPRADELVSVGHMLTTDKLTRVGLSDGSFLVYGEDRRALDALSVYREDGFNVINGSWVERVPGSLVDHTFFSTLRVWPSAGRAFSADDDRPGAAPVAIISDGLWQRAFGRDASALGRLLTVDGIERRIIGIMPTGFDFPFQADIFPAVSRASGVDLLIPLALDPKRAMAINFSLSGVGRLHAGVTVSQAEQQLDALFARTFERYPSQISVEQVRHAGGGVSVKPLKDTIVGEAGAVLWTLLAAVIILFAVACTNVATLVLVQTQGRGGEMAVRRALGAGSGQLTRQLLIESLVLALLGGVAGLALGTLGLEIFKTFAPLDLPRLHDVTLDRTIVMAILGVSLLAGFVIALAPALRARASDLSASMQLASGRRTGDRSLARSVLVVSQFALALVLLTGAGLMLRTSRNLLLVDPGFRTDNVLLFQLTLAGPEHQDFSRATAYHQQVLDRLQTIPGVKSATASPFGMPIENPGYPNPVWLEAFPPSAGRMPNVHPFRFVMPGYFETLGIPLLEGRAIDRDDIDQGTGAVVVSRRFAQQYWPNRSPIGQRVRPMPDWPAYTIVGVVGDTRDAGLGAVPEAMIYWVMKGPESRFYTTPASMSYAVHTSGDPRAMLTAVRQAVHDLNPALPLALVRTMDEARRTSMARVSFTMLLLLVGAVVGVVLAAVGVYGVMAYVVGQRTREIGVRMALGATPGIVLTAIVRQGLVVIGIGLATGLVVAVGMTRPLEAFLFGVSPLDPSTYAAVTLLLLAVGLFACYLPARRATRIDPVRALRLE
jgi:predicted permease